jgi:uncharacterized protein YjiS (DUF1127 family)
VRGEGADRHEQKMATDTFSSRKIFITIPNWMRRKKMRTIKHLTRKSTNEVLNEEIISMIK